MQIITRMQIEFLGGISITTNLAEINTVNLNEHNQLSIAHITIRNNEEHSSQTS